MNTQFEVLVRHHLSPCSSLRMCLVACSVFVAVAAVLGAVFPSGSSVTVSASACPVSRDYTVTPLDAPLLTVPAVAAGVLETVHPVLEERVCFSFLSLVSTSRQKTSL